MLLNFEAEAKSLRPRLKGPEAKAKILASRPVCFWRCWQGRFYAYSIDWMMQTDLPLDFITHVQQTQYYFC